MECASQQGRMAGFRKPTTFQTCTVHSDTVHVPGYLSANRRRFRGERIYIVDYDRVDHTIRYSPA